MEIPTGEGRFRPLQLLLPSSKRKSDTWDSRSKHVPVQWRYGIGASGIRTGATYRNGCLRSGELRWSHTSVARRDPPIKPALLAESRLVRYGEKKGKMPYEEFRKLFKQRPEPNRWQRIRLGSSIKWALAGGLCVIAVLLMR